MATKASGPLFVRLSDIADELDEHSHTVEKYLFRGVITADAEIKHGRTVQPIFLRSRVAEHIKAIRKYRESLIKEAV